VNTPALSAGQLEFAGIFARLERKFKLTKAEVARELRIERSYVSMLIKGQRSPRPRILEDMRSLEKRLLAGPNAEGAQAADPEVNRLIRQVMELAQTDRPKFEVVKQVVNSYSQANSKPAAAASKLLKKAAASVQKPASK
jgi:transcriptional regulator with XRE-family HTH domain